MLWLAYLACFLSDPAWGMDGERPKYKYYGWLAFRARVNSERPGSGEKESK